MNVDRSANVTSSMQSATERMYRPACGEVSPTSLPRWLKRNIPKGNANHFTARLIESLHLATVCEHARCPNRMECYARRTATFMILGEVCTRRCRFCAVKKGKTQPADPTEPSRVAEAVQKLGLRHVVITCVTRDDLPDGGAAHFAQTIAAIRAVTNATIEVLPSDFAGRVESVDRVCQARPDVYNHNSETVPRLYQTVRGRKANYRWTLDMFRRIKARFPEICTKTGFILGLGETYQELFDTFADFVEAGVEILTLGQYLRPSPHCLPVVRFLPPEEFDYLGERAKEIGFRQVFAGPFVRSSYHAGEVYASFRYGDSS
ncbi:MAG: lipoyl synthase [Thermogutta sp.]